MKPKGILIKPDLNFFFNAMPAIGMWMKQEYNSITSINEMIELTYKWFDVAEKTTNEVKRTCHLQGAYYLFSFITKKSFQSRIFESI